jgi:hypothetical protein
MIRGHNKDAKGLGRGPARGVRTAVIGGLASVILAAGYQGLGCAAVTNTTAVQCTSEAECLGRGPEFAGTTCDKATKTCVKSAEDTDLCTKNQECLDRAGGAPAICQKATRKCVPLTTAECPTVIARPGQLIDDNTVVIGMLSAAGATFDSGNGDQMEKAAALAQIDISKSVKGLPPTDGTSNVRPLVIVSCHEFDGGYPGLIRAANHLAKDVKVPVVIGPIDGANQLAVTSQVFSPNGVLTIIPFRTAVVDVPSPIAPTPLIWSLSFTDRQISQSAAQLITKDLEPKLRARGVTGPVRVAMIVEDNALGTTTADIMEKDLTFNGKSAIQNATDTPPSYLRVKLGDFIDPIGNPSPADGAAKAVSAVIGFKPHIILHSYAPAAAAATFVPLTLQWPQTEPRPYGIDLISVFPLLAPVVDMIDTFGLHGITFSQMGRAVDQDRVNQWLVKYKTEYPDITNFAQTESQVVQTWYDAVFYAAYAIAANGNKPLTGANLAGTLPRMQPPGQKIRTGTEDLSNAFGLLGSGQAIDVEGITGALDLDPRRAAPSPDVNITCAEKSPQTKKTIRFKPSGFYLEGGQGKGTISCD